MLTPLHGSRFPFGPKICFFYATPIKSPSFRVRRTRLNGIISPPHHEVSLDNFSFLKVAVSPLGGPFFGLQACWDYPGHHKMTHIKNGTGPGRNLAKSGNGPKIRFSPKKQSKKGKRLIFIGGRGTFSFAQLCPVVARTWLELRSVCFFSPKNPDFGLKICFLFIWDPVFLAQGRS